MVKSKTDWHKKLNAPKYGFHFLILPNIIQNVIKQNEGRKETLIYRNNKFVNTSLGNFFDLER